jgi:nicotinate-nucleotide adenylyltransferase
MDRRVRSGTARIGLLGGTFDPPHWGHYLIAREACEALQLDRVMFIPCRRSPHKLGRRMSTADHRLAMIRLMTRGDAWASVSRVDVDGPDPSYSYKTAEAMAQIHHGADLVWILGSDQWEALPSWSHPEKLAAVVRFAVFPRPHPARPRRGMHMVRLEGRHDIAASDIRQRVSQNQSIKGLVPDSVARYIHKQQLYLS